VTTDAARSGAVSVAFEPAPVTRPALSGDEVHVLSVDLDADPEPFMELLSEDERKRAARFHFDIHRRRYVVSHGALRRILAEELGADPAGLAFNEGERGKPALPAHAELQFNLSHSASCALVALTRAAPVGVDVEQRRPIEHAVTIARRYFSPAEIVAFDALPEPERIAAFYRCWTRKEAYLKATGEGLALPLVGFDVTLAPDEPARFLRVDDRQEPETGWLLFDLALPGDYAAALALEADDARVRVWRWEPA
jgi:4'-phosphopantetheinyl transferase